MGNKKYSAGLVSRRFWFYEFKQYIDLMNEGQSESEIKKMVEEENIFGIVSLSRSKEVFNTVKRRVKVLDSDMYNLFLQINIENQKLVVFIAVLLQDDLFLEFMLEVFVEKIHKQAFQLTITDFRSFFSEKQRINKVVAGWKEYTCNRLASAYRNYLSEAGLLRESEGVTMITPKILDPRVINWLKNNNRLDIAKAISGEVML